MEVRFLAPDLDALDQLKTEALCLPVCRDERPLRGAQGLVDWRLCGKLSKLLVSDWICGEAEEVTLLPARPRLGAERLLLFGAGPADSLDEARYQGVVERMIGVLEGLKVRSAALALPGRALGRVDPALAIDHFLQLAANRADRLDEVTVLDSVDAQRAMQPLVERARRRAMADLEG